MKTAKEIEEEFLKEFDALLVKYNGTFEMEDCSRPGSWHTDERPTVTIHATYDNNHDHLSEFCIVQLGLYRNPVYDLKHLKAGVVHQTTKVCSH